MGCLQEYTQEPILLLGRQDWIPMRVCGPEDVIEQVAIEARAIGHPIVDNVVIHCQQAREVSCVTPMDAADLRPVLLPLVPVGV